MATATYDATVKSVGKHSMDITVTDRFDGHLFLDPTLVIRIVSGALGLGVEAYDEDQIAQILDERFLSFELLQTKKQDGVFRVGLAPDDLARFSVGDSWESYDYGSVMNSIVGVAFSRDGKTAITGIHCDVLPRASVAAIESVSRKGFGIAKNWLHHPNLVAVGATDDGWWTAGGTTVRFWNASGAKMLSEVEVPSTITACCSSVVGTENGDVLMLPELGSVASLKDAISSISASGNSLAVGTAKSLYVGTFQKLDKVKLPASGPVSVVMNEDARWLASANVEEGWRGSGTTFEVEKVVLNESISFWSIYEAPSTLRGNTFFTKSYENPKIFTLDMATGH